MYNAVIIDDEPGNVRVLEKMLEDYCHDIYVVGIASNAEEGVNLIQTLQPEVVFLDVEMPYGNAFDILDRLQPIRFEVIFVTAFDDYTLKAFRYSALDYLLKPVNIEELRRAVEKAVEKIRLKSIDRRLDNLLSNLRQSDPVAYKLALPGLKGISFVQFDMIIRCEASKSYTLFYLKNGEKILSSKNIKEYEDILPPSIFMRVHNSHIINLTCIKSYQKGRGGYIEMEDDALIEVATRRKADFLGRFGL